MMLKQTEITKHFHEVKSFCKNHNYALRSDIGRPLQLDPLHPSPVRFCRITTNPSSFVNAIYGQSLMDLRIMDLYGHTHLVY